MKTAELRQKLDAINKKHKGSKEIYDGIYFDDDTYPNAIALGDAKRKHYLALISTTEDRQFEINSGFIIKREDYSEELVKDVVNLAIEYAYTSLERRNKVDLYYIVSKGILGLEFTKFLTQRNSSELDWEEFYAQHDFEQIHADGGIDHMTFTSAEIERLPNRILKALEEGRLKKFSTEDNLKEMFK